MPFALRAPCDVLAIGRPNRNRIGSKSHLQARLVVLEQSITLVLGLGCGCAAFEKFCRQLAIEASYGRTTACKGQLTLAVPLKEASVVFSRSAMLVFWRQSRESLIDCSVWITTYSFTSLHSGANEADILLLGSRLYVMRTLLERNRGRGVLLRLQSCGREGYCDESR